MNELCIVILAAGESSRLGLPKQLVQYNDKALLQSTIEEALTTGVDVYVVLGAFHEIISSQLDFKSSRIILNKDWSHGMSSSMKKAVMELSDQKEAIIFSMCDQPFLNYKIFESIIQSYNEGYRLINSKYKFGYGPPVLFHKTFFDDILKLSGDEGGKSILRNNPDQLYSVDFPQGNIDIDCKDDLVNLLGN